MPTVIFKMTVPESQHETTPTEACNGHFPTRPSPRPLLPYLLKGGIELARNAAGELGKKLSADGWDGLKRLAEKIQHKAEAKPALQEALADAQNAPQNEDAISSLGLQLKILMEDDPDLFADAVILLNLDPLVYPVLNHVQAVWQRVSGENRRATKNNQPVPFLGLEIRCALIENSLRHTGNVEEDALTPYLRTRTLQTLFKYLPSDMLADILAETWKIEDDELRAYALAALAKRLPELWPEVIKLAYSIDNENGRTSLFIDMAEHLPEELLADVLPLAKTVEGDGIVYIFPILAKRLPKELLPNVLSLVQEIDDLYARETILSKLAHRLPNELFSEALSNAREMWSDEALAFVLVAYVPYLPSELLPEALSIARKIKWERARARALTALAERMPELLPEALVAARTIENRDERAHALTALAKLMPEIQTEALAAVKEIQYTESRVRVLANLVPHLSPNLLPEALTIAREIEDMFWRADALAAISERMPELLPEALTVARQIEDARYRVEALITLLKWKPDLLPEALSTAREIQDADYRARALTTLTEKLPEILPEALFAAIEADSHRSSVLSALMPHLLSLPRAQAYPIWAEALPRFARGTRNELLSDLSLFAPLIYALGGEQAAGETFRAIQDVAQWRP